MEKQHSGDSTSTTTDDKPVAKRVAPSEIYRRAAEIVFSERPFYTFSCHAVHRAAGVPLTKFRPETGLATFSERDCALTREYIKLFSQQPRSTAPFRIDGSDEKLSNVRVLALLLMSEIAKDQERGRKAA